MKKIIWAGALLPLLTSTVQASVNIQTFSPAMGTSYVFVEDALMQVAPGDSTWTGERMYFHLKLETAEIVAAAVAPIRDKAEHVLKDRAYLDAVLKKGAEKARERAEPTLRLVYDRVGFIPKN